MLHKNDIIQKHKSAGAFISVHHFISLYYTGRHILLKNIIFIHPEMRIAAVIHTVSFQQPILCTIMSSIAGTSHTSFRHQNRPRRYCVLKGHINIICPSPPPLDYDWWSLPCPPLLDDSSRSPHSFLGDSSRPPPLLGKGDSSWSPLPLGPQGVSLPLKRMTHPRMMNWRHDAKCFILIGWFKILMSISA